MVNPKTLKSAESTNDFGTAFSRLMRHEVMVPLWLESISKFCQKPAYSQNNVNETIIACAELLRRVELGIDTDRVAEVVLRIVEQAHNNGEEISYVAKCIVTWYAEKLFEPNSKKNQPVGIGR